MCGKPPLFGFRTVAHSDIVCRANFGGRTRHFSGRPLAVGNHMISDRSNSASQRMARTTVGGFAGLSPQIVLALSAYVTEMGRSSVLADIAGLPVSLLDRFADDLAGKLTSLLRFLGPLTGASAMRAF